MQNLLLKLRNFMAGRNGVDKITIAAFVVYGLFSFIKIFLRAMPVAYIIASVLQYLILAYAVFRILSKNVQKRYSENFKFEQFLKAWQPYAEHLKLRIQFIKTHRFRTCKSCGRFLRFKKGKHKRTINCPECGKELTFHFLF